MSMRVSVLGVGAIGSVVAAALATTDVELHLHVRGERGAAQMLQGVAVSGHRSLNPAAARFLFSCEELPVDDGLLQGSDLVILACKSSDVPHLAQTATSFLKTGGVVLALCNGLGHVEVLTRIHGPSAVLAASTTHGAYAEGEGVVWAGFGGVGFAAPPLGPDSKRLQAVVSIFEAAELNPWIHEDAATLIWEKVVLNLA
ncbi:MAG: 2-dehydropantoate 2-reductase N-terminal domain-containing protein, partial [Candidatus Thermoplasmatota archaeon]|nr:2-dehydropantoate 2-reductase N-terminal domain-containing protein [Candidatus Thermoplasmatota archaeon]MEC8681082.1 2-dehydropantoate 2-reductase N-terminal domain-containing protein [Candidatus Thermoplasmatota archaeon]